MTTVPITRARSLLADLFSRVAFGKERVIISRGGKKIALVPVEDVEALEAIENKIDLEEARKSLADAGKDIAIEDLKKELGF